MGLWALQTGMKRPPPPQDLDLTQRLPGPAVPGHLESGRFSQAWAGVREPPPWGCLRLQHLGFSHSAQCAAGCRYRLRHLVALRPMTGQSDSRSLNLNSLLTCR